MMYVIPEIETEGLTERTMALLEEYYKNPRIGTLGLTKDELAAIAVNLPSADCDLVITDCGSDLIAVPHLRSSSGPMTPRRKSCPYFGAFVQRLRKQQKQSFPLETWGFRLPSNQKFMFFLISEQ